MYKVLIVCLGNICRSPAGEGFLRERALQRGIELYIESAGTGGWHKGDPPDARMIKAAFHRGIDLSHQRARQVELSDFYTFDMMLAMDMQNFDNLLRIAPANRECDIRLFLDFSGASVREMPDPYYGGTDGFETVLNLTEEGVEGFLDFIENEPSDD